MLLRRQVSWLAGLRLGLAFPGSCPVAYVSGLRGLDSPLTVAGAAPVSGGVGSCLGHRHRIPFCSASSAHRRKFWIAFRAFGCQTSPMIEEHPRLTLVLGGARSGKSRHAEMLVRRHPPPWTYIATAEAFDDEMGARIAEHRARREARWITLEAPRELSEVLAGPQGIVLVDCLTLWLSNILLADRDVEAECDRLHCAIAARAAPTVLVSNEVGLGIVPDNALARRFRDAQGVLNQRVAAIADDVVLMTAGLPLVLKSSRRGST